MISTIEPISKHHQFFFLSKRFISHIFSFLSDVEKSDMTYRTVFTILNFAVLCNESEIWRVMYVMHPPLRPSITSFIMIMILKSNGRKLFKILNSLQKFNQKYSFWWQLKNRLEMLCIWWWKLVMFKYFLFLGKLLSISFQRDVFFYGDIILTSYIYCCDCSLANGLIQV